MVMPDINIWAVLVAGMVPNALGALYYGPIFGDMWVKSFGDKETNFESKPSYVIYLATLLLGIVISFFMNIAIIMSHKELGEHGEIILQSHETFGHGAFHGLLFAMTLVVPVILSLGLFHRAQIKNMALNSVYWVLSFAIMGGVLDLWR